LSQGRLVVARVDVGREVRHVQGHRPDVQSEHGDHLRADPSFDLGQVCGRDGAGGVPEAAVVQHASADAGEPVGRGGGPPVGQAATRTRVDEAVQRGQGQVGAYRRAGVGAPWADHLVHDLGHPQAGQDRPPGGHRPERQVPGPLRHHNGSLHRRLDILGAAQVPFGNHLRLAVHPAHLA
jgi:hypothetical protein